MESRNPASISCRKNRPPQNRKNPAGRHPKPGVFRARPRVPPAAPALTSSHCYERDAGSLIQEPLFQGGSSSTSSSSAFEKYRQRVSQGAKPRGQSALGVREPPGDASRCSEVSRFSEVSRGSEVSLSSVEDYASDDALLSTALETVLEDSRDPAPSTPGSSSSGLEPSIEGSIECYPSYSESLPLHQFQMLQVPSRQNQEMVELSLLRLANLAYRNDETQKNQRDVCSEGGHLDVLSVMRQYPANGEIQKEAISALANLAAYSPEAQSMIGSDRGIEHILAAMRDHSNDAKLQDDGCCALWIMVDLNLPNALRLKRDEGMKTVVQAMRSHSENDYLIQDACSLMENYCDLDPLLKRDVFKAGGASALAGILENFRMEDETRKAACHALHRLTALE